MAGPFPPQQKPQGDGQVEGYERIVNGKVVKVSAYGKKSTGSTTAAAKARKIPGRPRIAAKPGSFSGGRDLPGQAVIVKPPQPPPVQFLPKKV